MRMLKQNTNQKKKMILNSKNYYDSSTDKQYQSFTFFKKFITCEAEAMAEINDKYKPDFKNALLVGNYLHSFFESPEAHKNYIETNKWEIYSKKKATKKDVAKGLDRNGQVLTNKMLSPFIKADEMINTLKDDKNFKKIYKGDKEAIVTGQIGGVDWKGKIDCLNLKNRYFVDLKTTQELKRKYWNDDIQDKEYFVAHWKYHWQMYVYRELIHQQYGVWCEPVIAAVTKQDPPDKAIISISQHRMLEAQSQVEQNQPHIEDVRCGIVEPTRCENCSYCRMTKVLSDIVDMDDLVN